MSAISIELPAELHRELTNLGLLDEPGVQEWVADAVRQKLAATKERTYLEERAARGNRDAFRRVLDKVPAVEPLEEDRW